MDSASHMELTQVQSQLEPGRILTQTIVPSPSTLRWEGEPLKALLLDSSWRPISFIKETRAIVMVMMGKAEVVSDWEHKYSTVDKNFSVPAIVRLPKYVHRYNGPPRFRRTVLYSRDGWSCQYCGVKLGWNGLTIDHVHPRSLGGQTSWNNCVTACKACNRNKGCKTLHESGMKLRKQPQPPNPNHFWDARNKIEQGNWHPMWSDFLGTRHASAF